MGNLTNYRCLYVFLFITVLLPKVIATVISASDTSAIKEIQQVSLDNPGYEQIRISTQKDVPSNFAYLTPLNATESDIQRARRIVSEGIAAVTEYNKARLAFPSRNIYRFKPGSNKYAPTEDSSKLSRRALDTSLFNQTLPRFNETMEAPPLYAVPEEVKSAAALLAELEAQNQLAQKHDTGVDNFGVDQENEQIMRRQSGSWWMEGISHLGTQPFGKDSSYQVGSDSL